MTLNCYSNRQQDVKDSQIEVMGKQENINFAKKKNTSFLKQINLFDHACTEDDCVRTSWDSIVYHKRAL